MTTVDDLDNASYSVSMSIKMLFSCILIHFAISTISVASGLRCSASTNETTATSKCASAAGTMQVRILCTKPGEVINIRSACYGYLHIYSHGCLPDALADCPVEMDKQQYDYAALLAACDERVMCNTEVYQKPTNICGRAMRNSDYVVIVYKCADPYATMHSGQSEQYFIKAPRNIAMVAGKSVFMNCSSQLNDPPLTWYFGQQKISVGSQLTDRINRDIINPAPNEYNLLIRSVQTADAGRYSCVSVTNDGDARRTAAELIVLESDPVCTIVSSRDDNLLTEFELVHMDCVTKYRGNWAPTMRWYFTDTVGKEHDVTDAAPVVNSTSVRSLVSVNMTAEHNGGRFKCVTYFNESSKLSSTTANNVPQYRHEWMSEPFSVRYGPRSPKTTIDNDQKAVLRCSADGNPTPTIRWMFVAKTLHYGPDIELCGSHDASSVVELMCIAANGIGEEKHVLVNETIWQLLGEKCQDSRPPLCAIIFGTFGSVAVCTLLALLIMVYTYRRKIAYCLLGGKSPDAVQLTRTSTTSDMPEMPPVIPLIPGPTADVGNDIQQNNTTRTVPYETLCLTNRERSSSPPVYCQLTVNRPATSAIYVNV